MADSGATGYFVALGEDVFVPTEHAGGAWSDEDLHVSPVAGLLVRHMDRWRAEHEGDDKMIGRVSLDILGRLTRGEITLSTRLVRPGRTIALLETTATIAGRHTLTARAWLMSVEGTGAVAAAEAAALPPPDALPFQPLSDTWPGGYIRSITARAAEEPRPGRARSWIRTGLDLVAGEPSSSLAEYVALVDTANGIAVRQHPREWMFPNLDLTLHFFRQPSGPWVGLDTTVSYGPTGQGLTSTILHDRDGAVGTAQQILTVRRQPGP